VEVNFTPDVQEKLEQMARDAGRPLSDVLDRRYDEMDSGTVQGIDGEEAFRRLMEKTQARRQRRPA
jgi:hypothetical protein